MQPLLSFVPILIYTIFQGVEQILTTFKCEKDGRGVPVGRHVLRTYLLFVDVILLFCYIKPREIHKVMDNLNL